MDNGISEITFLMKIETWCLNLHVQVTATLKSSPSPINFLKKEHIETDIVLLIELGAHSSTSMIVISKAVSPVTVSAVAHAQQVFGEGILPTYL